MVASTSVTFPAAVRLTHEEACRLSKLSLASSARIVVLDLTRACEATTAAFARLILLRRELLRHGRDFYLAGMAAQPAKLFEVHRLAGVLPRIAEISAGSLSEPMGRMVRIPAPVPQGLAGSSA